MQIPDRPSPTTEQLAQDTRDLARQGTRTLIRDVLVGTTSTPIAHGLSTAPRMVLVCPQADARVWRSATPDSTLVYLRASASVTCDIEVIP